ncbi:hypothetical protein B1T50_01850 [Mycobacterium kansasii]|nr:hypothetical protein B1T50_01850 [Mycobacterium kansasii]
MNDSRSPWTSSRGPVTPNRVWAVDFQFDSTTDGRPFKIVSIIDEPPTGSGPWTFSSIPLPMGARSRSSRSSTSTPANVSATR